VGLCAPAQIQKSGALCCTLLSDIWNYGLGCSDGRAASWGLGAGKSGALLRTTLVKKMDLWERLPVKTFKDLWQTWACKARMESKTGSSFSPSFSINEMRPTLSAPCATPTCARPVKHPADFFLKILSGSPYYIYIIRLRSPSWMSRNDFPNLAM
jgi:hypothetical protein